MSDGLVTIKVLQPEQPYTAAQIHKAAALAAFLGASLFILAEPPKGKRA